MISALGAQDETPRTASPAEEPVLPGGTSSSGLLSIAVTAGSYKSIKAPLDWLDIPSLAILTGVNGSGKTQLLEAIDTNYHSYKRQKRRNTDIQLTITGADLSSNEVLLLQDVSKARGFTSGYSQLEKQVGALQNQQRSSSDPFEDSVAALLKQSGIGRGASLAPDAVLEIFYANPDQIERAVAHHFAAYIVAYANWLLRDRAADHDICRKKLGAAPWDQLNQTLELATFPYRFLGPVELSLGQPIPLRLRHIGTDEELFPSDLSGGEATIIHFLLFNFAARRSSFRLKLLLLDEPDAHLHTSLIHVFLGLLRELTRDYGCRAIMSTHRIETIALAPEESLFVMHREAPRVRKSDDRARTIVMLTSNIVGILLAGNKPVFVEDLDDELFYKAALGILKEDGHWEYSIFPEFVASSTWAAQQRIAAGSSLVKNMVSTLRNAGGSDVVKRADRSGFREPARRGHNCSGPICDRELLA
jgi:predicted ATPase